MGWLKTGEPHKIHIRGRPRGVEHKKTCREKGQKGNRKEEINTKKVGQGKSNKKGGNNKFKSKPDWCEKHGHN